MNFKKRSLTSLYYDKLNSRFCIGLEGSDAETSLEFIYWHELKKFGHRALCPGTRFTSTSALYDDGDAQRGYCLEDITINETSAPVPIDIFEDKKFDQQSLTKILTETVQTRPAFFLNCQFSSIELENLKFSREVCFVECHFESNCRFLTCTFTKHLWMVNCQFKHHFSLKDSIVSGDVHLESSDFSGPGGVSFRGLSCQNLYLDLGVKGGDDLIWLNEVKVTKVLSIGGQFNNEVQMLAQQDESASASSQIGTLLIGCEIYQHEKANVTHINNQLVIHGIEFQEKVRVNELTANFVCINGITSKKLEFDTSSVVNDMEIKSCELGLSPTSQEACLVIENTSIGRHLKVENNTIEQKASLSGSAVSEVSYIEDNTFTRATKLDLTKFTSGRFLFHPLDALYGAEKFKFFSPKKFGVIDDSQRKTAAEQYCSLKHWLSDSGQLEQEDEAFYHMRDYFTKSRLKRFLFGGIFGWGVRLTNIALSSILVVLLFAGLFSVLEPSLNLVSSMSLSSQSFLGSFFGKWSDYQPDGMVASIVTLETALGVLFITVFIGSYIRKLLR